MEPNRQYRVDTGIKQTVKGNYRTKQTSQSRHWMEADSTE